MTSRLRGLWESRPPNPRGTVLLINTMPKRSASLLATALVLVATSLAAQQAPVNRALATREDLESALALGSSGKGPKISGADRERLQARLAQGDFLPGDRLVLRVAGEQILTDTFTVKDGQMLALPDMEPLSLHGVLRSELQDKIQAHVARYIKNPQVVAQALLRVGILGAVVRPGYYSIPASVALGDLSNVAGGLGPDAELKKVSILRDNKELWPKDQVRKAMASGLSVDRLGLKGGDEFNVGRRGGGFGATLAILTGIATLTTTIILLSKN